ncbi:MAG: 3-phosphoshikimate 1-carboxyvinyltransferase, partial [Oscillospiraceae bacterium]|nr:3-phosphoshikimate 1-carboxyvinyltransferase [Oscillospiraceae bacterium]
MKVTITPRKLNGTVRPPSSKSQSHRLIIAAALARGESRLHNISPSQDITATLRCMTALGARAAGETVYGVPEIGVERDLLPRLDCGESGSTLRFLIPVALA